MRSRVPWALACLALLAACGRSGEEAAVAEPSTVERNTFAGEAGFLLIRGTDTLAVERYTLGDGTLEGEILDVEEGSRLHYVVRLDGDGRVERMELRLHGADETEPRQHAIAEVRGDTLVAETRGGGEVEEERIRIPRGTFVHLGPSIATLEQMLRRARTMSDEGDERVDMPIVVAGRDAESELPLVERVTVSWIGADSVHAVVNRDNQFLGAFDAEGRIQHGMNPAQDVRVERIPR
jgi:hypothetical protein